MKCRKIKNLLADYIDNTLEHGEKTLVEEHIKTCIDCQEEIQFLKEYKKEISSFKKVNAPRDFLEKIHDRLNIQTSFDQIIKKLFFPLKIKLPLEAIGVLAMTTLIVLFYNPFKTEKIEYKKSDIGIDDLKTFSREEKPKMIKLSEKRKEKDAPITKMSEENSIDDETKISGLDIEDSITETEKKLPAKIDELKSDYFKTNEITLIVKRKIDSKPDEDTLEGIKAKRSIKSAHIIQTRNDIDVIREITLSLNGRFIKKKYDEKSKTYRSIVLEIPLKNYKTFVNRLNHRWRIKKQYPTGPPKKYMRAKNIQLNVQFEQ